jgi:flagellar biosynthesis chaperone FliJ
MDFQNKVHSFHIPVLGTGFTVDTPAKVAHLGIDSVISLADDSLIEKMREIYSTKFDIPFQAISDAIDDFRAKRITAYLNVLDEVVKHKFEELKISLQKKGSELEKYIDLLPDLSTLKLEYQKKLNEWGQGTKIQNWIDQNLKTGSIDVNIMTKLDKENYKGNEKLPTEYNDAHAALRGFAMSDLESSIVLSAGMNPRLSSYFESFEDFYPNAEGHLRKKIILKVSDYRSALIQGKFFAKKGLWISEYRIESGLNCGGHAFPSDGYLMGPIMEEFKKNRETLIQDMYALFVKALTDKQRPVPGAPLPIKVTAQGGVGTNEEHEFLLDYYQLDSIGWGTPFLLVPEASNVDPDTIKLLCNAKEEDLYISGVSPLGVPFNSIRNNTKDIEKEAKAKTGHPGAVCTKRFLVSSKEYSEKAMCTASVQYQRLKIQELKAKGLDKAEYDKQHAKIVDKVCLCLGLAATTIMVNNLPAEYGTRGVSICPGPNLAYFSHQMTLKEMVDHIYGRHNVIERTDRPNLFVKEISVNFDYLKKQIDDEVKPLSEAIIKKYNNFKKNLLEGIEYYKELFMTHQDDYYIVSAADISDLNAFENKINDLDLTTATL